MTLFEEILKASLDWPPTTDFTGGPESRVETAYTSLLKRFENEEWLGCGRNRAVFRRGRVVVKVPLSIEGEHDNMREAWQWSKYGKTPQDHYPLARCRNAGPLLVMEYVKPTGRLKSSPKWVDWVDCGQVGKTRKGRLVAYDYA